MIDFKYRVLKTCSTDRLIYVMLSIFIFSNESITAQCLTTPGQPIVFNAVGQNVGAGYVTEYLLTDYNGIVLEKSSTTSFSAKPAGLYKIYGVNYLSPGGITAITIGSNIDQVLGSCFELSTPFEALVCLPNDALCMITDGNYSFTASGQNAGLTTAYLLTDLDRNILQISSITSFSGIGVGTYLIFGINYSDVDNLNIGVKVSNLTGTCFDISNPVLIKSCNPCQVFAGNDVELCQSQTLVLSASGSPSTTSYIWSTGATTKSINITPTATTSYSVTATNSEGCVSSDQVMVNIVGNPIASIGLDKSICQGDITTLTATYVEGAYYEWSNGSNTRTINVAPNVTTTYTVIVNVGECSASASITVNVLGKPSVSITGVNLVCATQSTELTAIGGNSYIWNTGATTDKITVTPASNTIYTVTVTGSNGCTNTANSIVTVINCGTIGDLVWEDTNLDGIKNDSEVGIPNVTVTLTGVDELNNAIILFTTTDANGNYYFYNLYPGQYKIKITPPNTDYYVSPKDATSDESKDSDIGLGFETDFITLLAGEINENIDAGLYRCGTIGDYVWLDSGTIPNIQDSGDQGINGITVELFSTTNPSFPIATKVTMNHPIEGLPGFYEFKVCEAGEYFIKVNKGSQYQFVVPSEGGNPNLDSDVTDFINGTTASFIFGYAQNITNKDIGLQFTPLPIQLIDFTGRWNVEKNVNELYWSTASEVNNRAFVIERSVNGQSFIKIREVKGNGNSSKLNEYQTFDRDINVNGIYNYRLIQIDFDGKEWYSNTITINVNRENVISATVYPNPTRDISVLEISAYEGAKISIDIYGVDGKLMTLNSFDVILNSSSNRYEINLENFTPGVYTANIWIDGKLISKRIVKMNN